MYKLIYKDIDLMFETLPQAAEFVKAFMIARYTAIEYNTKLNLELKETMGELTAESLVDNGETNDWKLIKV